MHVSARATNRDLGAFDKEGPRVRARRSDSPSSSGSAFVEWLASALLGNIAVFSLHPTLKNVFKTADGKT